jgi:hypothetical protein
MRNILSWIKKIAGRFYYVVFLVIFVALLLEVIFRVLPTSDSLMVKPVNAENPILRYTENREVTKQIGFNFQHVTIKRINNYGYASDKEFREADMQTKPVISVIGDTYVEALQLKNKYTFHAILDENLPSYDVYPLGIDGSQMPQYLAFAKYADEKFDPKLYVFLIITKKFDNSFYDKSFYSAIKAPGFHYFDESTGLNLVNYEPSIVKKLLRRSAFLRYLYLDLKLTSQLKKIFGSRVTTVDNKSNKSKEFLEKGRIANERFLNGITEISLTSNIIILLDGDREAIYSGLDKRDINKPINILFDELGQSAKFIPNVDVIDLHNIFKGDYVSNNKKFNYDYDIHWNEHGHAVAARALTDKINALDF